MKIAIIAPPLIGGGSARAEAYKNFLQLRNHDVSLISFDGALDSKIWYYYQRLRGHLVATPESELMKKIADRLEKRIRSQKYDAVIGVETLFSYVLTRNLSCLKIFSWECIGADEVYYEQYAKKNLTLERVRSLRKMELEICTKSDYVVFPWKTTENYVRKYLLNRDNFITIKYGCYPQNRRVSYFFPVSIVSLGNLRNYWSNKELLSYLTQTSPYVIDVYGAYRPPRKYHLNYRGFASSHNILTNYQFGLNTTSKDIFRRNHHSSRILSYLAYGLPVLSPDWLKFSHEVRGVLPYNEDTFVEILEKYSDQDEWEQVSQEAYRQSLELDWKVVLQPLVSLIEKQ